jgi:hypothetical protein
VSSSAIDPDGVLAMSAATVALSGTLAQDGEALQREIDAVSHLVGGGAPEVRQRTEAVAGDLAELAGWARSVALKYVDDIKPLRELASLGFWLPDVSKLGWDAEKTALENLDKTARSDEFGAFVLGVSAALLARYRRWQLHVPRPGVPIPPGSMWLAPRRRGERHPGRAPHLWAMGTTRQRRRSRHPASGHRARLVPAEPARHGHGPRVRTPPDVGTSRRQDRSAWPAPG